jgi:putative PIN family toxin of toxin-antitoxin system
LKRKLRAVVDTDLFVSGIFAENSLPAKLQDLWVKREFELAISIEILKEISRVLQYPKIIKSFRPKEKTIRRFFRLVFRKAVFTKGLYAVEKIADDPDDNMFLACAVEAKADSIVSGDKHLLDLKIFQGIKIVGVKEFVDRVEAGKDQE